ncbi:LytR/AlgR family response regulator transcription factor [Pseudonocardia sp. GCM10023141]|uniref:LytR/AlgR family response regulator transcription factor n=1 Tax=Pseudonocardia sp. GCM10023141 TaxID=3252653 RepID=UPI00361AAE0F
MGPVGMTVLAVDDEEHALAELAYLLGEDEGVETVLTASDATETLRILNDRQGHAPGVDAVFLDIRMPGLDGLELAKVFSNMAEPPPVVFVTAHEDRAVDAYEVGAVDYLLKPLRWERLVAALNRIRATKALNEEQAAADPTATEEIIPIELAGITKLVPRSDVRFVEAQGDYARLHTREGSHLVRIPLAVLEERWQDAGFVRIHRSYVVALPLVTAMRQGGSGHTVTVGRGGEAVDLPVSRRHVREVRQRLRGTWRDEG